MYENGFNEDEYNELIEKCNAQNETIKSVKNKKFNPYTIALLFYPLVCLTGFFVFVFQFGDVATGVFAVVAIGVLVWFLIGREVVNSRKNKKIKELEKELGVARSNAQNYVFDYLCSVFALSRTRLDAELELLARVYPNAVLRSTTTNRYVANGVRHEEKIISYDFWQSLEHINTVEDLLAEKFKKRTYTNSKQELSLQNLELKNESIAIDNTQKKFWTCQFCGNMNRADDMSCIKCGGIRPSME